MKPIEVYRALLRMELPKELDWYRSARGNLTCVFSKKLRLTVFPCGQLWRWCLGTMDGPKYSKEKYASEKQAQLAVEKEAERWEENSRK